MTMAIKRAFIKRNIKKMQRNIINFQASVSVAWERPTVNWMQFAMHKDYIDSTANVNKKHL